MPRFRDIPQLPQACYQVDVPWSHLEDHLVHLDEAPGKLDLDPDYQREHVWARRQQVAYVEYCLMGGEVGRQITLNSPDWMGSWKRPTELVDGKQRLEAVRAFLRDEFRAHGHLFSEYEDRLPLDCRFQFRVCKLETREEILQLYLNINAGGTPHTKAEITRVRKMLAHERGEDPAPRRRETDPRHEGIGGGWSKMLTEGVPKRERKKP